MMVLDNAEDLKNKFSSAEVNTYYKILQKKKVSIVIKRAFDLIVSALMLILCSPLILFIAVAIKIDSGGKVIFKQERITRYGKHFNIYKFRTMVENAEKLGTQVTVDNDVRITRIGKMLRKYRLDELLQLINIIKGEMGFVGTRPEVKKYVEAYTDEMYATLLLPAGVTSLASIYYKNEDELLFESENADETYINEILPQKMKYNLEYIKKFSFWYDIKIMFMTVFTVCKKDTISNFETEEKFVEKV